MWALTERVPPSLRWALRKRAFSLKRGTAELGVVEEVEEFETQLQLPLPVGGEVGVFPKREVEVVEARAVEEVATGILQRAPAATHDSQGVPVRLKLGFVYLFFRGGVSRATTR
jgi:hypothetical protein